MEPAVKIHIEYLESKKGRSPLKSCQTLLWTEDDFTADEPKLPPDIDKETTELVREVFTIPKKEYAKEAKVRVQCEDHGVMGFATLALPDVPGVAARPTTTFFVCQGEFRSACGSTPNWVPCKTDIKGWVKATHAAECQAEVEMVRLSSVGGNQCGYDTWQVTCKNG